MTALVRPPAPTLPLIPPILLLAIMVPTRPVMRLLLVVIIPTAPATTTATPPLAVPPIIMRRVTAVAPTRTMTRTPTRRTAASGAHRAGARPRARAPALASRHVANAIAVAAPVAAAVTTVATVAAVAAVTVTVPIPITLAATAGGFATSRMGIVPATTAVPTAVTTIAAYRRHVPRHAVGGMAIPVGMHVGSGRPVIHRRAAVPVRIVHGRVGHNGSVFGHGRLASTTQPRKRGWQGKSVHKTRRWEETRAHEDNTHGSTLRPRGEVKWVASAVTCPARSRTTLRSTLRLGGCGQVVSVGGRGQLASI